MKMSLPTHYFPQVGELPDNREADTLRMGQHLLGRPPLPFRPYWALRSIGFS